MKKIIALSIVGVLVLSMGVLAFADNDAPGWYDEMIKWKKAQVNEAVKNDALTEEQAKYYNDRIDAMEEFHEENGFNFPMGCGGYGRGPRGFGRGPARGQGFGQGFGPGAGQGMMWNYQNQN